MSVKAGEEAKGELPEPQKECPGADGAPYPRSAVPESSVGSSETPARVALQSPAVLYGCTKLPPKALPSPGLQAYPRHGSGVFMYLSAPTATPLRHCPVLLLLQGSPPSRAGAGSSSGRAEPFASRPNHGAVPLTSRSEGSIAPACSSAESALQSCPQIAVCARRPW